VTAPLNLDGTDFILACDVCGHLILQPHFRV
jgi:hypothetical protein